MLRNDIASLLNQPLRETFIPLPRGTQVIESTKLDCPKCPECGGNPYHVQRIEQQKQDKAWEEAAIKSRERSIKRGKASEEEAPQIEPSILSSLRASGIERACVETYTAAVVDLDPFGLVTQKTFCSQCGCVWVFRAAMFSRME